MTASFKSGSQKDLFNAVIAELRALRYTGHLLKIDYSFGDWLAPNVPTRRIDAAAFGQTPVSYDTACFGVVLANGVTGGTLIGNHRSLGAPIIFEVAENEIAEWAVGPDDKTTIPQKRFGLSGLRQRFADHSDLWSPREFLRSKSVGAEHRAFQYSLFAGLIPELEINVRDVLDPILRNAIAAAIKENRSRTGAAPDEADLFRLAFSILTGKVFHDRAHAEFSDLSELSKPEEVIERVASHYGEKWGRLLSQPVRQVVFDRIWSRMDFRNLSVDVLSHIWANTLVTGALRKRMGIHRTPRSIVRYIVDRIPFERFPEDERFVLEPCSGSAVFLVAALNRMRDLLGESTAEKTRHAYFQRMLRGVEKDPAGVEIGRLCLALADYPNANGWMIEHGDVFTSPSFAPSLAKARVVLCNPPFEDVPTHARDHYGDAFIRPPLELLNLAIDNVHSDGVLGFVLPQVLTDGEAYAGIRRKLVERFEKLELVTLPDRGWDHAEKETAILIATGRRTENVRARVTHRKVGEKQWQDFAWFHRVGTEDSGSKTKEEAARRLSIPDLGSVWHSLRTHATLSEYAAVHRGIEWNKNLIDPVTRKETGWRDRLVRSKPFAHSMKGIPPKAKPFYVFQSPPTAFLDVGEENALYEARLLDWSAPKVILNAARKGRGAWRLAAFADTEGLVCYQTYTAAWPHDPANLQMLAAIINGPVANAFVATREIRSNTIDTIKDIPYPHFDATHRRQVERLIAAYLDTLKRADEEIFSTSLQKEAVLILKAIDAVVLACYDLPPRTERALLDYCSRSADKRHLPNGVVFTPYFPKDFKPFFALREYLSKDFSVSKAGAFRADFEPPPPEVLAALKAAVAFRK
jgi:N-6 DNA Methylase